MTVKVSSSVERQQYQLSMWTLLESCFDFLGSKAQHAAHEAHKLHLAHRGSYSIERLQAFNEYNRRTSLLRVFGICFILPLPALLVAIGMECVPLQHPREGWRANYGAFTRDALMFFMTCFGLCVQARQLMRGLSMSMLRMVLVSVAVTTCSISLRMLVADMWVYPIPFGYAWGAAPDGVFLSIFFVCAVGLKQIQAKPSLIGELWKQLIIIIVHVLLCQVYPAYNAVYLRLGPWQQTLFVFVLPLMKFVLQSLVSWSTKHIVEYMPGVTVFSVEVFNALYLAKCMQSAGSVSTFVAIMVFDAFESVMAYRDMKAQTQSLYETMALYNAETPQRAFVDTVIAMCQEPGVLSRRGSCIRIRSPIKLTIPRTNTAVLDELVRIQSFATDGEGAAKPLSFPQSHPSASAISSAFDSQKWFASHSKIYPTKQDLKGQDTITELVPFYKEPVRATTRTPSENARDLPGAVAGHNDPTMEGVTSKPAALPVLLPGNILHSHSSNKKLSATLRAPTETTTLTPAQLHDAVDHSLKVLFQCEYHALVEYVEAMIPMLYCVYVALLTHLPSHVYYPETRNITPARVVTMVINIFTYAWLEILSFVMMHFSIKWKFGFSPAYLLAFVLENQAMEFQARLLVWFTYILEITLVHYGVDLTLKFAWLKGDWSGM